MGSGTDEREGGKSLADRLEAIARELRKALPPSAESPITAPLVTEARLAELTGLTVRALEGLRVRGDVTEGLHFYRLPTGRIGWDTEAFRAWQRGVPDQAIQESRSGQAAA